MKKIVNGIEMDMTSEEEAEFIATQSIIIKPKLTGKELVDYLRTLFKPFNIATRVKILAPVSAILDIVEHDTDITLQDFIEAKGAVVESMVGILTEEQVQNFSIAIDEFISKFEDLK